MIGRRKKRALSAGLLAIIVGCGENRAANEPPVAVIGPDRVARPGEEIQLRGDSSTDPDGMIVRYVWDFGDGTMAEGAMVSKAWPDAAVYAVSLTVEDDGGRRDTAAIRVTVEGSKNEQPTAVVDGPSTGAPDEALTFDGSGSTDPDGMIVEHSWDFGDGGTATGSTAVHRYSSEGAYTVTLRVSDDRGAVGQATRSVRISQTATNQPPVAAAGPDKMADANETVSFTGRGSVDADGSIVSYVWDLGDGSMQQKGENLDGQTAKVSQTFQVRIDYVSCLRLSW